MRRPDFPAALLANTNSPSRPTALDEEFFADLDKLKAINVIPLALGGDAGQYRWTWDSVMAEVGGKEHWQAVWVQRDPKAMKDDVQRKVFETFRRLRNYVDKGSSGRAWNATTNLVISGQAGMQILGDWGKAEFEAAGQKSGVDFGCGLSGSIFVLTGDVLAFPKQKNTEDEKGQKLLAKVMMAQQTQLDFYVKKGSIPPRTDVSVVGNPRFDDCTQIAAKIYNKSVDVVGNSALLISADEMGSVVDLVGEYFNSPEMKTDEAGSRRFSPNKKVERSGAKK